MNAPDPLIFPTGIRLATREDIPQCTDADIDRIRGANITTGWRSQPRGRAGCSNYFEANVQPHALWEVFEALAERLLPDVAAPIVGWKDGDPTFGPYTTKFAALSVFNPYLNSLRHDGFIEFGLIYQYRGVTEEVFVTPAKYLQIWTNQPDVVCSVLREAGLQEVKDLQFIDEFPRVTERLESGPTSNDVISAICLAFESLVPIPPPE